jgi:hypothetical protein
MKTTPRRTVREAATDRRAMDSEEAEREAGEDMADSWAGNAGGRRAFSVTANSLWAETRAVGKRFREL